MVRSGGSVIMNAQMILRATNKPQTQVSLDKQTKFD